MLRTNLTDKSWIDIHTKCPPEHQPDFDSVMALRPQVREERKMFGKVLTIPRFVQSYGKSYAFASKTYESAPVPEALKPFLDYANTLGYGKFNQVLVNWYMSGSDSISFHSDDEKDIEPNSAIVSLSLGSTRTFVVKSKSKLSKTIKKPLQTGTILVMGGEFQKEFVHGVPKEPKVDGPRINVTLRQIK